MSHLVDSSNSELPIDLSAIFIRQIEVEVLQITWNFFPITKTLSSVLLKCTVAVAYLLIIREPAIYLMY